MGGCPSSAYLGRELIEYLQELSQASVEDDRNTEESSMSNIAIDSRIGNISKNGFDPQKLIDLDNEPKPRLGMLLILNNKGTQTTLPVIYDGTKKVEMALVEPKIPPKYRRVIISGRNQMASTL
jgi:hypothetical protein